MSIVKQKVMRWLRKEWNDKNRNTSTFRFTKKKKEKKYRQRDLNKNKLTEAKKREDSNERENHFVLNWPWSGRLYYLVRLSICLFFHFLSSLPNVGFEMSFLNAMRLSAPWHLLRTSCCQLISYQNFICKGWFTCAALDVCGCGRRLHFHRDRKFSIFPYRTLLPQLHASNSACVNQP